MAAHVDHEIAIIVGTRPEAIKLAPLADLLRPHCAVIHTNQHRSAGMSGHLLPDWALPGDLDRIASRGQLLGHAIATLDELLRTRRPGAVIVQGDTTSALAGALAANAADIPLVHVEAGLRSYDRRMPEEHNRIMIDHLADLCCAPTEQSRDNLIDEGIPPGRIAVTGNTIVDAVIRAMPDGQRQTEVLQQIGVASRQYILATLHRPENTDNPAALVTILERLISTGMPVVLPLHHRAQRRMSTTGLMTLAGRIRTTGPLDHSVLLTLIRHSALVVSDSGGVQEEATILRRPIMIVRRSNERLETEQDLGTRVGVKGLTADVIRDRFDKTPATPDCSADTTTPYGDGTASQQIVRAIEDRLLSPSNNCNPAPGAKVTAHAHTLGKVSA